MAVKFPEALPAAPARAHPTVGAATPAAESSVGSSVGLLVDRSEAPVVTTAWRPPQGLPPADPLAAYPSGAAVERLVAAVRDYVTARDPSLRGLVPPSVRVLEFVDADLSLLDTAVELPLIGLDGEPVRHPETGEPILLGLGSRRNQWEELEELRAKYPDYRALDKVDFDRTAMGDPAVIEATRPIRPTLDAWCAHSLLEDHRVLCLTKRPGEKVGESLEEYLGKRGVAHPVVLAIGRGGPFEELLNELNLSPAQEKSLLMQVVTRLYDGGQDSTRRIPYLDDNPEFLKEAMLTLPKAFPTKAAQIWGVIHRGGGEFRHFLVGHYDPRKGKLLGPDGTELVGPALDARLEYYLAKQRPLRPED
jgi:hypothetical protein